MRNLETLDDLHALYGAPFPAASDYGRFVLRDQVTADRVVIGESTVGIRIACPSSALQASLRQIPHSGALQRV